MVHLFRHETGKLKGKFDFAIVRRGKYICGSNQGYEKKTAAVRSIVGAKECFTDNLFPCVILQDDTSIPSRRSKYDLRGRLLSSFFLPKSKPYKPSTKKK